MAYSLLAKARLSAYRHETPEERSARHAREQAVCQEIRKERRALSKAARLAAQRLAMWYREQGRT